MPAAASATAPATAVTQTNTPQAPTAQPTNTAVFPTPPATPTTTATPWPVPESTIDSPGAQLPPGFSFKLFADIYRPTSLAFSTDGALYITSFDGTVHILRDTDSDGRADSDTLFAQGFNTALGITLHPQSGDVYISDMGRITLLRDTDSDGHADVRQEVVSGLPNGLHQNDNLKFGPDGMLYMGIGSTCDACTEEDPRSATIMRFNPETGEGEIIAAGLRNPFDLAFHPQTGDLFATDNGRDDLGMEAPQEELNHIIMGSHYGWPDCWDDQQGPMCAGTETAVAFFESHSSANSLDFYTGSQFPPPYQNSLFVAIFGSWLKAGVQTGIQHITLTPTDTGYTATAEWFATWPDGMPLGLIAGSDGALYVGDYINNKIYRISYGSE
ncbi:MAG: sorbosone dehydrogenase family protein [Candidatus Promineifilaceae bacterium]